MFHLRKLCAVLKAKIVIVFISVDERLISQHILVDKANTNKEMTFDKGKNSFS